MIPISGPSNMQGMMGHGDDDSQQAAEAMVQLSGFYGQQQQDESLDIDPNYDPSDYFLGMSSIKKESSEADQGICVKEEEQYGSQISSQDINVEDQPQNPPPAVGIQDDLAISDSDDEMMMIKIPKSEPAAYNEGNNANNNDEGDGDLWF